MRAAGYYSTTQSCRELRRELQVQMVEKKTPVANYHVDHNSKQHQNASYVRNKSVTNLQEAMTMKLSQRPSECTQTLGDRRLLAILSTRDVVAQALEYHHGCLVALYNQERAHWNSQDSH